MLRVYRTYIILFPIIERQQTQSIKVVNIRILYVPNKGQQKESGREFEGPIRANPKIDIVIVIVRIFFFAK